jgi:CHAD domain-containing protein
MSYRLANKSFANEVERIVRAELEGTLKEVLGADGEHSSTAVHEARKHLKKARALIRLLRPGVGDAFYKRENTALRSAAQRMSPIRDAHVRVQTLRKLIARFRSRGTPAAVSRIRRAVAEDLRRALAASNEASWSKQVAADVERVLCRISKWPLKRVNQGSIRDGVQAAYKRARRAIGVARREPSDTNFHELRKCVKDLGYHLRLLRGNRPPPIKALIRRMRELSDNLGDDHDLAMLMATRDHGALPTTADWTVLEKIVAPRRARLQRDASRLAARVLARKPRAFADFVVTHWATR